MDRREFLKLAGASSAGLFLARNSSVTRRQTQSQVHHGTTTTTVNPNTSTAPVVIGHGSTPITMWVQLFGPTVIWFEEAAKAVSRRNPDVKITVLPLPYASLQSKILPSIAAGTEADIMMAYDDWFYANDVSQLFLDISKYVGGAKRIDSLAFPAALTAVSMPAGSVYYMPDLAGVRGAALTVNAAQFEAKGVNYLKLHTWADVVSAAQELTETKHGKIVRAGLSPITGVVGHLNLLQSWVWQLGGEFYNAANGHWKFSTEEGMAAAQELYDLFWKYKVSSFDLVTGGINSNETTQFQRGLVSSNLNGMWQVSSIEETVPGFRADAVVTPVLTGAVKKVWDLGEISVITLSKRLSSDGTKLKACVDLLLELSSASTTLGVFNSYSGSTALKSVYKDRSALLKERYGAIVERIGPAVWPIARYAQYHVSDMTTAGTSLTRALQKQISIKEALANIDRYLNEQERLARQRLRLPI